MNIVCIGSSGFGLRCLQTCLELSEVNVAGVVTAPRTFSISYRPDGVTNVLHADIAEFAQAQSIPVLTLAKAMNEPGLLEGVLAWKPDAFVVAGWYHMIPKRWREHASAYGLHASLLPDYSGGAPLVWAMINGEAKAGITLFQMDDGVDSGPIAAQREELILPTDTIASLYARIEEHGRDMLREVLPLLAKGNLALRRQDDSKRRIMPQRSPEDGLIDWQQDAIFLERFIRAQTRPYPGTFTILDGQPLHVWQAKLGMKTNQPSQDAGQICTLDGEYVVACGSGYLTLKEVSYEQKNYSETQLAQLFGGGGQRLGALP